MAPSPRRRNGSSTSCLRTARTNQRLNSPSGSSAVEVAMKMACQYWANRGQPRQTFIALHHAYHGDTVAAMSASEDSIFTRPFASMLFEVIRAHSPYCYRCPLGLARPSCEGACLGERRDAT